jgi:glycosyltransferase involved in cell wall biosynthesis
VDDKYEIAAKVRILWMHAVHVGDRLTPERDQAYDAYFCLSAWHVETFRARYPAVAASKVQQVRNGIEPSDFRLRPGERRDPLRAVYSSAPSRGLQTALDTWPAIRARVPGATLHLFYGFESWEQVAKLEHDQAAFPLIAAMKRQIADTEGIVYHGKVDPARLAQGFRTAGVWAYPCSFQETSCITAMQAQAAGLRIVSSALAALPETVGERGVLLTQDPLSEEYRAAFVEATSAALLAAQTDEGLQPLRDYAEQHFDLERLSQEFVARFRQLILQQALQGLVTARGAET